MTKPDDPNRVLIFDTTLRDGEQSPGISLNAQEKLEIAQQLARLGVDVIEAGFPITSPGDFEAVQAIARAGRRPGHRRAGPHPRGRHRRRLQRRQGRRAPADPHLHLHLGHPHQVPAADHARGRQGPGARRRRARQAVRRRRRVLADGRHPRRPRVHRRGRARSRIDEGATTINIPDTVGYAMPARVRGVPARPVRAGPRAARRRALGPLPRRPGAGRGQLASRACRPGARQVECAVNGIGERAGNASLEEIVMLLHTRQADARPAHRRGDAGDRADLADGLAADRLPGAAQQGDRRAQRVRPRVRHPPGRRAQGAHHLRDHGRHHGRPGRQLDRARQALRPPRAAAGAGRAGLRALRAGAEHRLQALQGDRRQEEAGHRDGPRGAGHRRAARRRSPATRCSGSTSRPPRAGRRTPPWRCSGPTARSWSARSPATAPSTPSSTRSTPPPASTPSCASSASTPSPAARTRSARPRSCSRSAASPAPGQGVSTDILEAGASAYVRALSNAVRRHGVLAEQEAAAEAPRSGPSRRRGRRPCSPRAGRRLPAAVPSAATSRPWR